MIRSVDVSGFQSLKDVSLTLGRLTVISGESDVGKSALVRALRAAVTNRYPRNHVTRGEKISVVKIGYDDVTINAMKGGGTNRYAVIDSADDSTEIYDKVGSGVPYQVEQRLGLTEKSFGAQFDPLFLVADKGSHRAKKLGGLSNLVILMETVRLASTKMRRLSTSEKQRTKDAERMMADLEEAEQRREPLVANYGELKALVEEIEFKINTLTKQEFLIDKVRNRARTYREAVQIAEDLESEIPDIEPIQTKLGELRRLDGLRSRLMDSVMDYERAKNMLAERNASVEAAEGELASFKAAHDVCPTCGKEGWHE